MSAQIDTRDIHVLIVEDDSRLRTLLKKYLMKDGYWCTIAKDAEHAIELMAWFRFDLLIVDVMMPGKDGVALTRELREFSDVPVIFLSALSDVDDRIAGLDAGGDDYIGKPFDPRELLLRMQAVLRRVPDSQPTVVRMGEFTYDFERSELLHRGAGVHLPQSESSLMDCLARRANKTVTRQALAAAGGSNEVSVEDRAVDNGISRLRRKLEQDPRNPRYLRTVRGVGYRLTPDSIEPQHTQG
ncbi:MAG: response regulator transcription factor [Rhodobacteraceae bacterium]|nr:response regulator transcription factor [Paracoccaceae bacterium]